MFERLLRSLWLVFILSMLILTVVMAGALVQSQSDEIHGVEQNVVYNIQLIIGERPLYSDPEQPPYNIVQYMPSYYGLMDKLAGVFGIDAHNVMGIYLLGRSVSAIFALGIAALVWWTCLHFGMNPRAALGCLFLAILLPMPWFILVRPDAMMTFFNLLAFVLFMLYLERSASSVAWLFGIGFCLALAFFAKQTAVLFIGLILIFPFYKQALKDRFFIILGLALGFALHALLLSEYFSFIPSTGNAFYLNVVEGVTNRINFFLSNELVYNPYFTTYRPFFILPMVLTIFIVNDFIQQARQSGQLNLQSLWPVLKQTEPVFILLLLAFWWLTLSALVMDLKDGAAMNYMIESMLIGVLLLSYYLSKNPRALDALKRLEVQMALGLVFAVIAFSITSEFVMYNGQHVVKKTPESKWEETISLLETEFAAHPDSAFIYFPEDVFDRWLNFYFYEHVWFTSREIYGQAFFDISSLQGYLDDGTVRYFVTDKIPFPEEVFGYTNFAEIFELWQETPSHYIYLNRNSGD